MEFERKCLLSIFFMLGFLLAPGVTTPADRGVHAVGVKAKQSGLQNRSLILSTTTPSPSEASEPQRSAASAARSSVGRDGQCDLTKELYDAAWKGDLKNVKRFLDYGADPNAFEEDNTVLRMSAQMGHATVVELLLQRGADVNMEPYESNEWSALHSAAQTDRRGLTTLLLINKGAYLDSKNADEQTPLHLAAKNNNAQVVRLLVDWGASKDVTDTNGKTPFDYAHDSYINRLLSP